MLDDFLRNGYFLQPVGSSSSAHLARTSFNINVAAPEVGSWHLLACLESARCFRAICSFREVHSHLISDSCDYGKVLLWLLTRSSRALIEQYKQMRREEDNQAASYSSPYKFVDDAVDEDSGSVSKQVLSLVPHPLLVLWGCGPPCVRDVCVCVGRA